MAYIARRAYMAFRAYMAYRTYMAYGAYIPENQLIGKTVLSIILLDTFVALIAGIAIFPIVFSNSELMVNAGPSLIFETLPVAFYSLPFGSIFSVLFFILLSIFLHSAEHAGHPSEDLL